MLTNSARGGLLIACSAALLLWATPVEAITYTAAPCHAPPPFSMNRAACPYTDFEIERFRTICIGKWVARFALRVKSNEMEEKSWTAEEITKIAPAICSCIINAIRVEFTEREYRRWIEPGLEDGAVVILLSEYTNRCALQMGIYEEE